MAMPCFMCRRRRRSMMTAVQSSGFSCLYQKSLSRNDQWKSVSRKKCGSTPTPGSWRPKTGQGGTFSIWRATELPDQAELFGEFKHHRDLIKVQSEQLRIVLT